MKSGIKNRQLVDCAEMRRHGIDGRHRQRIVLRRKRCGLGDLGLDFRRYQRRQWRQPAAVHDALGYDIDFVHRLSGAKPSRIEEPLQDRIDRVGIRSCVDPEVVGRAAAPTAVHLGPAGQLLPRDIDRTQRLVRL